MIEIGHKRSRCVAGPFALKRSSELDHRWRRPLVARDRRTGPACAHIEREVRALRRRQPVRFLSAPGESACT
jgi:hypothetical protein